MSREPELTPAQCLRVFERIALSAALASESMRAATQNHSILARADMLESMAMVMDTIGAMADRATGFQMAGSFDEWMFGHEFENLGRDAA